MPKLSLKETCPSSFKFNPFSNKVFTRNSGKLVLFVQPIKNFYSDEPIAAYSPTMAECTLFLNKQNNFSLIFIQNILNQKYLN